MKSDPGLGFVSDSWGTQGAHFFPVDHATDLVAGHGDDNVVPFLDAQGMGKLLPLGEERRLLFVGERVPFFGHLDIEIGLPGLQILHPDPGGFQHGLGELRPRAFLVVVGQIDPEGIAGVVELHLHFDGAVPEGECVAQGNAVGGLFVLFDEEIAVAKVGLFPARDVSLRAGDPVAAHFLLVFPGLIPLERVLENECAEFRMLAQRLFRFGDFLPLDRHPGLDDLLLQLCDINFLHRCLFIDGLNRRETRHLAEVHPGGLEPNRGEGHIACRNTDRDEKVPALFRARGDGAIRDVKSPPCLPHAPLVDEVILIHGITGHMMGVDVVRTNVNHVGLFAFLDDVSLSQNVGALHAPGGANVEIPGPVVVVLPFVLAESILAHLVAHRLRNTLVRLQEPKLAVGVVAILLMNLLPFVKGCLRPGGLCTRDAHGDEGKLAVVQFQLRRAGDLHATDDLADAREIACLDTAGQQFVLFRIIVRGLFNRHAVLRVRRDV